MSGQWEKYVEPMMAAAWRERFGPNIPLSEFGPEMEECVRAEVRAVLDVVGPLIAEDTRVRMVAAAGRAVERDADPRKIVGETDPFASLADTLAFSSNDWASASDFAWLYGIILGWDSDDPDEESSMPAVAAKHEWSDQQVERLRALHRDLKAVAAAYTCHPPRAAS